MSISIYSPQDNTEPNQELLPIFQSGKDRARLLTRALRAGASAPGLHPSPSNRGVEFQNDVQSELGISARLHTTSLTIYADDLTVRAWADSVWTPHVRVPQWEYRNGSNRFFRYRWYSTLTGVQIYAKHTSAEEEFCSVEIPGGAMDMVDAAHFFRGLNQLKKEGIKIRASRLDLALDVPFWLVEAKDVRDHVAKDAVPSEENPEPDRYLRSLVKRESIDWVGPVFGGKLECGRGGTLYMGARSSERMLRVYDKDVIETCYDPSGSPYDYTKALTRFELETHKARATTILHHMLEQGYAKFAENVLGHILDFADFLQAEWWEDIKQDSCRAGVKVVNPGEKTVEQAMKWLVNQVAPTLAMVQKYVREKHGQIDYADELAQQGKGRMNDKQKAALAVALSGGGHAC